MHRVAAGSVLLAACGLASAGSAEAAESGGSGPVGQPLTSRVTRLADVDTVPVDRAAALVKNELPQEAAGQIYLRSPLADG
ncbi:hypothetical protein [Streptomyces sp. NPDC046261]|uniref:hypothetical protein n=1 Tax=Streptomyces sp. NPDC046261 TaxID=3157200 RepID=UPI0033D79160